MDAFTTTDNDLVFRRTTERWLMVGVLIGEGVVFSIVALTALGKDPKNAWVAFVIMGFVLMGLAFLTAWMWTYEVRITPYELIQRSIFGGKAVSLLSIVGLERRQIKGKSPPQFVLKIESIDGQTLKVADLKREGRWLHETLREKCRSLKQTDFVD